MRDYIVGSFNIQHLNNTKDFKMLAKIIKEENFDIVAIQEVRRKDSIDDIVRELNSKYWEAAYTSGNEEYAFIWKKRRLRKLDLPRNKDNPVIVNNFKYKKRNGEVKLVRPPYVGYFTAKGLYGGCNFDLRLINAHIAFSKPYYAPSMVTRSEVRRNELKVLTRELYDSINTKTILGVRSIFTVLLGDFNLVLAGEGDKLVTDAQAFYGEYPYITKNGNNMVFDQEYKTSLKQSVDTTYNDLTLEEIAEQQEQGLAKEGDYYSRNYDHFAYSEDLCGKYKIKCTRVDALGKYYENNIELYRKKISDHVPIKMVITLL